MPCNGNNHPPNCECGWGGTWNGVSNYTSKREVVRNFNSLFPTGYLPDSITVPNACCPVCGAVVFYCEPTGGGRVFFDELGPPWQKHACTDKQEARVPTNITKSNLKLSKEYRWMKDGWQYISKVIDVQPSLTNAWIQTVTLQIEEGHTQKLYVRYTGRYFHKNNYFNKAYLIFIKPLVDDLFEIQMLCDKDVLILNPVYSNFNQANSADHGSVVPQILEGYGTPFLKR